ncbi:MAG: GWxTD domain-containing protein [Bacteroidia bacterium]
MFRLLLLLVAFWVLVPKLPAQTWNMDIRYSVEGNPRVEIWIKKPAGTNPHRIAIQLNHASRPLVYKNDIILEDTARSVMIWAISLPAGVYTAKADLLTSPFSSWEKSFSIPEVSTLQASSLVLSSSPILDPNKTDGFASFSTQTATLHYFLQYRSLSLKSLSVRAILYRKERSSEGETFTSLEQKATILSFQKKLATFSGKFELDSLEAGTYLIEMLAYEDDKLVSSLERNRTFTVAWSGMSTLLEKPEETILRMSHITDNQWVNDHILLSKKAQQDAILQFWEGHNPDEPRLAMARYFRRIEQAEARFTSWENDQARIYTLFGEADVKTFQEGNTSFQRWHYKDQGLVFLFRKKNETFVLIN